MASISLQQLNIVEDILNQISDSIHNLEMWNEFISDARDFHLTPEGVKTLAADCMLIEATCPRCLLPLHQIIDNVLNVRC